MPHFFIVTQPMLGHVAPVVSISRTLVERGSEVTWIAGRSFRKKVEDSGAFFLPYPEKFDPGDIPMYEFWPEMGRLKGLAQAKWVYKHVFLDVALPLNQAMQDVIRHHPVDVIVGCTGSVGVFAASRLTGIPLAVVGISPLGIYGRDAPPSGLGLLPSTSVMGRLRNRCLNYLLSHVLVKDVYEYADRIRLQLGNAEPVKDYMKSYVELSSLIMQLSTPAFEFSRQDLPGHVHFIGPVLPGHSDACSLPVWWKDLDGGRPVVLVNQGTVANNLDDVIKPAVEALKDEDFLVVAVPVGEGAFPRVPGNVRTGTFIPFDDLLPNVSVMVTNGGYGGTQLALAHGVPMVVAGATEDKMDVAARIEWSGAGINLRKKRPSPAQIKKAVKEVFSNPTYRENAKRIQQDFEKYDAPTLAAELLEQLAERGEIRKEGGD